MLVRNLKMMPFVGPLGMCLKRFASEEILWRFQKRKILSSISDFFENATTIDVTQFFGFKIFHNKGNTLAKRAQHFEADVREALLTLVKLNNVIGRQSLFADIGCNIGLHTFFLKSRYKDMHVLAFDPSPASWKYFELSLAYNNISGVRLEKTALYSSDGFQDFFSWGEESSADSLKDTKRVPEVIPNIIKVPVRRLDDFRNLPNLTLVKLDCEGSEIEILKGAENTIKKYFPFIVTEINRINRKAFETLDSDIFSYLKRVDYSIFSMEFEKLEEESFAKSQLRNEENYILLPNQIITKGLL